MALPAHPIDDLAALALAGQAPSGEVAEHLRGCPDCRAQLDRLRDAAGQLGLAVEPLAAPESVRASLRQQMTGPRRLQRFADRLAAFFDLDRQGALDLIRRLDIPAEWMDGPDAGISVLPVQTGPRAANALAGMVRLPDGVTMLAHPHVGLEQILVLEGGFGDSAGHVVWPGETLEMPIGSEHAMWGLSGPDCLAAVLLWMEPPPA